jgi:hypothetical protein
MEMYHMKTGIMAKIGLLIACLGLLSLNGCASNQQINLNIHTEPEGAHIIYRLDNNRWTYLGATPLDTVEIIHEDELKGNHTFSMKAMRCGYLDQAKEWTGDELLEENDNKGMIFWTPRLIKNTE